MPTDVVMPQMGESIFEGTITKWLKKAGDTVEKDEPLFEISTDKVDAEMLAQLAYSNPKLLSPLRHRSAERQREKEVVKRRLAALTQESAPVRTFLEENVVLFNAAAERMFRREAANVIGRPLGQLLPPDLRNGTPTTSRPSPRPASATAPWVISAR